jgi:hypothetical protein
MPRKLGLLATAAAALTVLLSATAQAFTFAPAQTRPAGPQQQEMHGVEAADVDGDGLLDAVASGYFSGAIGGDPVISVLRGRANGTLAPAQTYPMTGAGPLTGIALGDFNGDGSPDAALGSPFGEELVISLGDGEGAFEAPTSLPSGGFSPDDPLVADFNDDGDPDLASVNGGSYSVYLGNGDGSFEPALNEEVEDWALTIASGDFDANGTADLALGNVDWGLVRILLGDGDGTFTAVPSVDLQPLDPDPCGCVEIWGIAAGDIDGNGRDDLVISDRFENRLFSVLSNPDGTFTPKGPFVTGNEGNPIGVALGDLDADGDLDAVTADYLDSTGTVLSGDGAGNFAAALEVESGDLPYANVIADIGGDGKPDLLFADQGWDAGAVTLVRNAGLPTISLAPNPIDFGAQAQQTVSPPRTITVTNEGDALLHVNAALLGGANGGDFLANADDCTAVPVLAGQSCTVSVRFVPGAPGPREGSVVVLSDVPGLPAIQVTGTGTALPQGPAGPSGLPGPIGAAGPAGKSARLVLALAQGKLTAVAGERVQLSFATTLPGRATLNVKPGKRIVKRTLRSAGTGTLAFKLARPGTYKLKLGFKASDGQQRNATAKLVVSAR